MKRLFAVLTLTIAASSVAAGSVPRPTAGSPDEPRASYAYAVLVLRKAAVTAELADLTSKFTEGSREVLDKRFELSALGREMERMSKVGRDAVPRLSDAYGKLILSKIGLEVELHDLLRDNTPEYPGVKKKRVELTALEREIESILK